MAVSFWLLFGAAALLLAVINLIRITANRPNGKTLILFLSLSCGIVSLAAALALTYQYVQKEDFSALLDVTPSLYWISVICAVIGVLLNAAALLLSHRKK